MRAFLLFAFASVAVIILVVFAAMSHQKWVNECKARGGWVMEDTDTVTTWSNGKPSTGTTTDYFCLTADGRILDKR